MHLGISTSKSILQKHVNMSKLSSMEDLLCCNYQLSYQVNESLITAAATAAHLFNHLIAGDLLSVVFNEK